MVSGIISDRKIAAPASEAAAEALKLSLTPFLNEIDPARELLHFKMVLKRGAEDLSVSKRLIPPACFSQRLSP